MTSQTGTGAKTLTWDQKNRTKTINTLAFTYDPMDYRIGKTGGTQGNRSYYLEGEHLEAVYSGLQLQAKYFRGSSTDELLAGFAFDSTGNWLPQIYPKAAVICDLQLPVSFFDEKARKRIGDPIARSDKFKSDVLTLYPHGHVLAIVLHSVVNLWGIALYSQGQFVRSVAGSADEGILSDSGTPLPEEFKVCEGRSLTEINANGDGEELVFDVSRRLFGKRIDNFQEIPLVIRKYEKAAAASVFKKMVGLNNHKKGVRSSIVA